MTISGRRRGLSVVAIAACSATLMLSVPTSASAATEIWNGIFPRGGNPYCIATTSLADKAQFELHTCDRGSPQKWYVEHLATDPNVLIIQNVASEKCMDIPDGSTANDAKVQQYKCNGKANQTFVLDETSGHLRSNLTGKCVVAHSYNKGSKLYQYDCITGTSTEWTHS